MVDPIVFHSTNGIILMYFSPEDLEQMTVEELDPELASHLVEGSLFPMIHHKLIIQVPYHKDLNKMTNTQFKHKKEKLQTAIETENWSSYVFIHERPYRFDALQEVLFDFHPSEETAFSLIASVWVDSENIFENFEAWQEIWNYGILNPKRRSFLMDSKENAALAAMPDTIEIYRGTAYKSAVEGISWTTDKKKAIWFAKRMNKNQTPLLASATVKKENVLAFFRSRNESEIVVDPDNISILEVIEL